MPDWERRGGRLFYERWGNGRPPLVFVHGNGCTHDDWEPQVEFFRARHEVVTPDLRGHGASADAPGPYDIETLAADVVGLLEQLNLPPALLIGHSMGCRVVLQAHLDAPERVAGLVLVDGSRMGQGDPAAAEAGVRREIERVGFAEVIRGLFTAHFLETSDATLRDRIVRRAATFPERVGAPLLPSFVGWDARAMDQALSRVAAPLLIIQSTYMNTDMVRVPIRPGISTPWLELVRRHVPEARIEIVPGVGHFTMLEAPSVVNRVLAAFVAGLPAPGR